VVRRPILPAIALLLGLGALMPRAASEPKDPFAGDWSLEGSNKRGPYTGTARVERLADGRYSARISYAYEKGPKVERLFLGKQEGAALVGERGRPTGIVDAILGDPKLKYAIKTRYELSPDGTRLEAKLGATWREALSRTAQGVVLTVDANRDGVLDEKDADAMKTGRALVTRVPRKPLAARSPLRVVSQGPCALKTEGPGQVRIVDADGNAVPATLGAGTHDLFVVGTGEGDVLVRADDSQGKTLARALLTVKTERLYLILFGYQGAEEDYLPGDMGKAKKMLLPRLTQAGYAVIEDGESYDQPKIDAGLADPNRPAKVVVDWCVTPDDWKSYLERGSTRGIFWSSHGFMEPWIGCPDEDLLKFECRVWTSALSAPALNGEKHFLRQWKAFLDAQEMKLDFAVMHSCCTAGLGSYYAPQAWDYTNAGTKERVRAKYGDLPDAKELDQSRTFELFAPNTDHLETYKGPSYFGLMDVDWDAAIDATKP
jgi:hypothetical protein